MNDTVKEKLTRLLAENPDLPIRVLVYEELACNATPWGTEWGMGELKGCEVTEYAPYGPEDEERLYVGRGNGDLWEDVREDSDLQCENLSDNELNRITRERIDSLDWQKCILLRVGP